MSPVLGQTLQVPHTPIPIRIDGRLEAAEWQAALEIRLDRREQVWEEKQRGAWGGVSDLSAVVRVAYDAAHLYLGGEVRDNSFLGQVATSRWESGDAIEFFFSRDVDSDQASARGATPTSTFDADDIQLFIMPFHDQRPWGVVAWDGRGGRRAAMTGSTLTGVKVAFHNLGADRYSFEAQVPFHALFGVDRPAPTRIGFALAVDDHDAGSTRYQYMTLDGRNPVDDTRHLTAIEFVGPPPLVDSDEVAGPLWGRVSPWLSLLSGPALAAFALWLLLRNRWGDSQRTSRMRRAGRWLAGLAFTLGLVAPRIALDLRQSARHATVESVLEALRAGIPEMERGTLASYGGAQREQQLLELLRGNAIPRRRYFEYADLADLAEGAFGYGPRRYPGEFFEVRPYFIPLPAGRTERIDFRRPLSGQRLVVVVSMPQPVLDAGEPTPPRLRLVMEGDASKRLSIDLTFDGLRVSASAFDRDRRDLAYELVDLDGPLAAISLTALHGEGTELVGLTLVDDERAAQPLDLGQPALTGIPATLRGPYPEDSGIELRAAERRAQINRSVVEGFDRAWVIYSAAHPGVLADDLLTNAAVGEVAVHFRDTAVPPRVVTLQHQRNVLFERSRNNQVQVPMVGSQADIAYAWTSEAGERMIHLVTEVELPRDQAVEGVTFRVGAHYPIRFRAVVFGREREAAPSDSSSSPLVRADASTVRLRDDFGRRVRAASFAIYRDGRLVAATAEGSAPDVVPRDPLAVERGGVRATRDGGARVYESFVPLSGPGWRDNVLGVFVRDASHERFSRVAYTVGLGLCLLAVPVLLLMLAEAIASFSSLRVRLVAALTVATLAPLAVLAWLVLRVVEEGHEAQQRQRLSGALEGMSGQLATLQRDLSLSAEAWLQALVDDAQARLGAGAAVDEVRRGLQQRMASQRPPEWKGGFLRFDLTPPPSAKARQSMILFDGDPALRGLETPLRPEPSVFAVWGLPVLGVRRQMEVEIGSASLSVARPIDGALLARLLPQASAVLCDVYGYPLAVSAGTGVSESWLQRLSCRAAVMADRRAAIERGQQSGQPVFTSHRLESEPWLAAYGVLRDVDATPRALLGVVDVSRPASLPLPIGRVSIRGFLVAVAAVLLLFAVSLSSVVTNRISRPIEELARGAQALGQGDLDVHVEVAEGDGHLARLTHSFNRMAQELRGRIGDLRILHAGMRELTSKLELRDALSTVVRLYMQHSPADRVRVLVKHSDSDVVLLHGDDHVQLDGADPALRAMMEATGPFSTRIPARAMDRPANEPGPSRLTQDLVGNAQSAVGFPLAVAGRSRGCVLLLFDANVPRAVNTELLSTLATQSALAIENSRLYMAAVEDPFTGAYVPDFFRRRLADDVAAAQAQGQGVVMLAIALLDGDRLQASLGADRLARCMERVTSSVRGVFEVAPVIGRWTSSELRVLVTTAADRADELSASVVEMVGRLDLGLPPEWAPLRTAVVAARFPSEAASAEFLLDLVDQRLEAARQSVVQAAPPVPIDLQGDLVATSAPMQRLLRTLQRVAPTDIPILVEGETGTGKELMADLAHRWSRRRDGPLVKVHCAALPETLLQSELFGFEKGAFTGAEARKLGKFELARGGTVFLDEIGETSLEVQVKLLRVLQQREIDRVGGLHPVPVDVRIVAATNRNLRDLVARGTFREDLYYRLQGMTLSVPPLRERRDEIPALVERFCAEARAEGNSTVRGFTTDAMDVVYRQEWPGNVRELRNAVMRAAVLATGPWVDAPQLVGLVPAPQGLEPMTAAGWSGSQGTAAVPAVGVPVHHVPEPQAPVPAVGAGRDGGSDVEPRLGRLLSLIAERGAIALEDHVLDSKVSPSTALRDLNHLIRQRRIVRHGSRRGARYVLVNDVAHLPTEAESQKETAT